MNRFMIKYMLLLLLGAALPVTLFGQKEARKNIREGNKQYQQQKYSEAADRFGAALEENPTSKEAAFNLGNTLYRQKEWSGAVEQYQHFVSLEQENPAKASDGWHNIGNAMLQQKDLQGSMEAYKMALRLNPDDNEARYNLAVVQKMIQDEEQDQDDGEQDQQQDQQDQQDQQQDQQQESPQNPEDQEKRPEQQEGPEQMSRDNARQLLQAIEQDERETQEKVQQIKAQEREEQAEENRRRNKNW